MIRVRRTETFVSWLRDLRDAEVRVRIARRIDRLALGNAGDIKAIGGGLSEMRISYGPGYRLYCAWRGETLIVLLCGGSKGSQQRDIERAKGILRDIEDEQWWR